MPIRFWLENKLLKNCRATTIIVIAVVFDMKKLSIYKATKVKKILLALLTSVSMVSYAVDKPGYLIDKDSGCKVWTGDVTDRVVQWTGNCEEGFASGQGSVVMNKSGKFLFETNATYVIGKMDGRGTIAGSDGDKYIGEFKDGFKEGQGTYFYTNGTKYIGSWSGNQINGWGMWESKEGAYYIGQWKDGQFNGWGKFEVKGSATYEGEFKNHKKNGKGIFIYAGSGKKEEGLWENDKFIRAAIVEIPDDVKKQFTNPSQFEKLYAQNNNLQTVQSQSNTSNNSIISNNSKLLGVPVKPSIISQMDVVEEICKIYASTYIPTAKSSVNIQLQPQQKSPYANYFSIAGYFYLTGCGLTKDIEEAKYWLELGAKNGDVEAIHNLAWLYQNGLDGKQELKKAVNLYAQIINLEQLSPSSKKTAKANLELIPNYASLIEAEPEKVAASKTQEVQKNKENTNAKPTNIAESKKSSKHKGNSQLTLEVTSTEPDANGMLTIKIKTNEDTASLTVNGVEEGGKSDGKYEVSRLAKVGQKNTYTIVAKDVFGTSATKVITVERKASESKVSVAELKPTTVKSQPSKDAVAIIIGIADYKNLPKADFANDDARIFYDYAIRGLGVKAENIKLLVDADADQAEIYRAFKAWLPTRVKATTDVYVFYSGHGLPTADGKGLYLLPQRADRDFMDKTAINQQEINDAIQATKPKSVTIFLDSCYSGAARTGQSLVASARPVTLKATTQVFPADFTVFTASTAEQISSSSPDLKHGIFSYYLMKGMEGDADTNKDGKITAGEMHTYLTENVAKQASIANRVQQPQLTGDANRVLVGR